MNRANDIHSDASRDDILRVVVPREQIARRVDELAEEIARCYRGRELSVLAVLTGSLVFLADLIRRLPLRLRLQVMTASSYGADTEPGRLVVQIPSDVDLEGHDVLIVDDVLDTGHTLGEIIRRVSAQQPASLRCCVLLDKARPDIPSRPAADFCGFRIDGQFVVGYGLDVDNLYRNLPDICVLKESVLRDVLQAARGRDGM